MKNLTKALVGTVAAGAMAVSTASPALASDGKTGAGEIIAGALVIGGIAAIAATAGKDRNDGYAYGRDRRYGDPYRSGNGYRYGTHPDGPVERCIRATEREAQSYHYGRADVSQVTSVKRKRNGYDVNGRIQVRSNHRGGGHGYYDRGTFRCKIRYGRIADVGFSGIRGLH